VDKEALSNIILASIYHHQCIASNYSGPMKNISLNVRQKKADQYIQDMYLRAYGA
jgi:hypothetical protein